MREPRPCGQLVSAHLPDRSWPGANGQPARRKQRYRVA
jgi:hypothetical protein